MKGRDSDMKRLIIATFILIIAATAAQAETRFVRKVMDGHTLKLLNGEIVRIIGIDVDKDDQAATEFVRGLVSGSVIELNYDIQRKTEEGYLLAYVWFPFEGPFNTEKVEFPENYEIIFKEDDRGYGNFYVFLNATVIKSGFGTPNALEPNVKHAKFFDLLYKQKLAQESLTKIISELEIKTAAKISE